MLVAALRQRILELAIQGKLVPQSPEDGNADELYQQIQLERKKLIAAGKLKKEKPLPSIKEEEIPFNIPKSWKWCRIGELFTMQAGKFISAKNISEIGREGLFPCYGGNGCRGYVDKYNREGDFPLIGRQGALCGNIKRAKGKFYATEHAVVVDTYAKTNVDWVCAALTALHLNEYATATAQPGLAVSKIMEVLIPLPPMAEQRRIAQKANVLFAELEVMEQSQERVAAIQAELNKRILERAIQGKLVPQLPEEGTAEDLYQQIQREKKKLIAAGKFKKEKPLPPISEEEIPFDIPHSWKWVRLGEIVYSRGQCVPQDKFSYIDIGSIDNKACKLSETENIIEPDKAPSRARKIVGLGDILYSTVRPYLHNMCVIDKEFSRTPIASTGFAVLTCHAGLINDYLFYYMLSPTFDEYANRSDNSKGMAYPAITEKKLLNAVVPLPPQIEQRRIVESLIQSTRKIC